MQAKQRKGYTEIKMAAKADDAGGMRDAPKASVTMREREEIAPSSLSPSVQTLVKFFFDEKMMESSIVAVNVDIKKMPLG